MGYATYFSMFIKRKKNRSGTVSIVVAEKSSGFYKEFATIGIAKSPDEIDGLLVKARVWIDREEERRHPRLDLFGEERKKCEPELLSAEQILSCITNISINGADLILDRVFDNIGFNRIEDIVFRQLVKARLAYPVSKSATVEYLKNHFDEDVSKETLRLIKSFEIDQRPSIFFLKSFHGAVFLFSLINDLTQ